MTPRRPPRLAALVAPLLSLAACAPSVTPLAPVPTALVLEDTSGARHTLESELHANPFTVVTFFSSHCPCQRAHDARLRELIAKDAPRGVGFLVVDPAPSATPAADAEESRTRGYPILLDRDGRLARAVDAEYATYSVVLDDQGRVRYHGGIDSDKDHLHDDATPFLGNALDDLLAGHAPRVAEGKALGCALQKW